MDSRIFYSGSQRHSLRRSGGPNSKKSSTRRQGEPSETLYYRSGDLLDSICPRRSPDSPFEDVSSITHSTLVQNFTAAKMCRMIWVVVDLKSLMVYSTV